MSENRNNNRRNTVRNLKNKVHNRNIWIIILVILALAIFGHVVWCLANHMGGHVCPACMLPEQYCNCEVVKNTLTEERDKLVAENASLIEANAQLTKEIEYLREQNALLHDGECHAFCPVHCPECKHEHQSTEEGEKNWFGVGTQNTCRKATYVITTKCDDCGKILDTDEKTEVDNTHNFGGDHVCDDCGYHKTSGGDGGNGGNGGSKPTVEPTAVPTTAPTAEPTAAPTTAPTAEPTAAPTAEPTAEPTTAPTQCPHKNTKKETIEGNWEKVSTEGTCRKKTITTKVICKDCGVVISTGSETQTDTSHSFNGRTCGDCGYKRPKQEGSGEAEGTVPAPETEWTYEDEGEMPSPVVTSAEVATVELVEMATVEIAEAPEVVNVVQVVEVATVEVTQPVEEVATEPKKVEEGKSSDTQNAEVSNSVEIQDNGEAPSPVE